MLVAATGGLGEWLSQIHVPGNTLLDNRVDRDGLFPAGAGGYDVDIASHQLLDAPHVGGGPVG